MSLKVKRSVFAHNFLNPPAEDRSCDINLELINPSGLITLTKEGAGIQTRYLLLVSDPSIIGLNTSNQIQVERRIKDLVLAFNLCLVRTCLSTLQGDLPSAEVKLQPSETKVKIEQTSDGQHISVFETITLRSSVHIRIGTHEELDEKPALNNLKKIIRFNRLELTPAIPLQVVNVAKALNEYENAMTTFDRLRIFKNLFNTLEFGANWNGVDRRGPVLDSEIASISNVQESIVRSWRDFYNRTKHVDRSPIDASEFIQGMENLTLFLPSIREATKQLIIDRLNRI